MKKLILLSLLTLSINVIAQKKMYIWPLKNIEITQQESVFKGYTLNLIIIDSREITANSKVEFSSQELLNFLSETIRKTYPSATFKISENPDIQKGVLSIKINIRSYYATFYTGMWHAQTRYIVDIYNYENNSNVAFTKDIEVLKNFYNVGGYATAKKNLKNSFVEANNQLFEFFKECFLKMSSK